MAESPLEPDFDKQGGLLPVVVQEAGSGVVLMLAYMNREAYEETLRTGRGVYYSRSRDRLWRKGEESGNVQHVRSVRIDCDLDALLLEVEQVGGAACHTGHQTCFYRELGGGEVKIVAPRVFDPGEVYPDKPNGGPSTA